MLGIENYNPHFYTSTKEIFGKISEELKKLIDKKILEVRIVWDTKNDEWFKDCPVVLNIEGIQVEICTSKIDELAVTFNTIDMSNKLNWYDKMNLHLNGEKEHFQNYCQLRIKK